MADVSSPPTSRLSAPDTLSRCRMETVTATHDFEVSNFSQLSGNVGVGWSVRSVPFSVGGYDWAIQFYPDGTRHRRNCFGAAAAAYVTICNGAAGARAKFTLSLVGRDGRASRHWRRHTPARTFGWPQPTSWGFPKFYLKPFLRLSRCLVDDRLTIRCELTVFTPLTSEDTTPAPPPPPELPGHLRSVLRNGRGTDVTFDVAGRVFRAHRVILAARSPVFCAELFGPMAEGRDPSRVVEIVDMEPTVFAMLLDFIYSESVPGNFEGYSTAMMQDLLVAADRYGLDRLKLMCVEKLHKNINVSTVMATLALADQHHCPLLKEACIAFITSPKILRLLVATDQFKQLMATSPLLLNACLDNASSKNQSSSRTA